jgi:hypothetical protein
MVREELRPPPVRAGSVCAFQGGLSMRTIVLFLALCASVISAAIARGEEITVQNSPPVVVKTVPQSGAADVDPGLAEIRVTFSKDMLDKSWSCVALSKEAYPGGSGELRYEPDKRTFVMPVELEPGRTYAILFNSEKYTNFKDTQRRAAMPYLLVFQTKK